jgi:hypothetical protein
MALPTIDTPRYELTLPSQDIKVQYRPFLVKEEKILMMAMESKENKEIVTAIKEVLNACTFEKLDINKLPMFDLEYILLQVRAKSVGEMAKFRVLCPDDKETFAPVEIDLSKINVEVDDGHTNNIMIDESRKLGVVFNYPTIESSQVGSNLISEGQNLDTVFGIIVDCIDHIYEGDKTYSAKDSTKQELKDFIENLSQETFKKIKKFFDTMPHLRHEVEVENPKTKVKNKITFKGLQDFFQ